MPQVLVNPMNEAAAAAQAPAPRLASLEGRRLALLDISKPGGSVFLDHLEQALRERYQVAEVLRERKPTFTKPAPAGVLGRLISAKPDAVIEALAD
ncbi:MAG: hypothetical protein HY235_06220 [Acidobacteria bacterium]|nr:hypothetical protein [Acidobacteriota bacterium]